MGLTLRIAGVLELNDLGQVPEIEDALTKCFEWGIGPVDELIVEEIKTEAYRRAHRLPQGWGTEHKIIEYLDKRRGEMVRVHHLVDHFVC